LEVDALAARLPAFVLELDLTGSRRMCSAQPGWHKAQQSARVAAFRYTGAS
jgi:hypothetical protein